jgi:hypothetical protein
MTDSTDVYWDIDGVSLQTYAFNISTLGGSRDSVPGFRGQDVQFAYKGGATERRMVADSRTVTLAMWVVGMNEDGTVSSHMERQYNANRRKLKQLLWKPRGATVALTKRWHDPTTGAVVSATARGRCASNLEPTMGGPYRGAFTADVFLPDPWFYGAPTTTTVPLNTPTVVANLGDDYATRLTLHFKGGSITTPRLENNDADCWMKIATTIASSDQVDVDNDNQLATRASNAENLIGAVTHGGAHEWMYLLRGDNELELTAVSGTGEVDVVVAPAYF